MKLTQLDVINNVIYSNEISVRRCDVAIKLTNYHCTNRKITSMFINNS